MIDKNFKLLVNHSYIEKKGCAHHSLSMFTQITRTDGTIKPLAYSCDVCLKKFKASKIKIWKDALGRQRYYTVGD